MRIAFFVLIGTSLVVGAGCASNGSGIIIDKKGTDMSRYEQDLAECQEYAKQVESQTAGSAAGGAVVGGVVGAIFGGGEGALKGAGAGAVVGVARGESATGQEKKTVVKNCLRNRGYKVLN